MKDFNFFAPFTLFLSPGFRGIVRVRARVWYLAVKAKLGVKRLWIRFMLPMYMWPSSLDTEWSRQQSL